MASLLTNCYIPLPSSHVSNNKSKAKSRPHASRKRPPSELRQIYMDTRILSNADGSSVVEMGQTKVVCAVHGPRSFSASSSAYDSELFHEEGILNVDARFALPFAIRPETVAMNQVVAVDGSGSSSSTTAQTPEEIELSSRVYDAIFSSLVQPALNRLFKSVLDVHLVVLQADGGLTSACIVAVSLALADAGVELYGLVPSCSVAISSSSPGIVCLADPTEEEIDDADGILTLAVLCSWNEVTFWNQSGRISLEASSQAMEMCKDGCINIHQCMRQCLLSKEKQQSIQSDNK